MQAHLDKINEMASVMRKAIEVDEGKLCEDEERIKQLEVSQSDTPVMMESSSESFGHMRSAKIHVADLFRLNTGDMVPMM